MSPLFRIAVLPFRRAPLLPEYFQVSSEAWSRKNTHRLSVPSSCGTYRTVPLPQAHRKTHLFFCIAIRSHCRPDRRSSCPRQSLSLSGSLSLWQQSVLPPRRLCSLPRHIHRAVSTRSHWHRAPPSRVSEISV